MVPAIFGLGGPVLTADERAFLREAEPAGYIMFARNCESASQLRRLTDDLRSLHGRDDLFVSIDQEGGRVARMKPPAWPAYPPGAVFDRLYDIAPISAMEAARMNALAIGLDLAEAGISCDALPLLDIARDETHAVIGDRALGRDPRRVASLGRAVLDGLLDAGVQGIIKHMPGHGRATADSHRQLPVVTASDSEMESDLAPFRALNGAAVGMTAHIVYTAWDEARPATQSPVVIEDIIRQRIGFDGLLLSDDIDMEALSGTIPERSRRAIAAGCDLVLNCWARPEDMAGIADALPEIGPRARARLDAAMASTRAAEPFADAERRREAIAKRDELLSAAGIAA